MKHLPHAQAPEPAGLDFHAFLAWSEAVSRTTPGLQRWCETRIARAFESMRPALVAPPTHAKLHRCHLASHWCEARGLPASASRTALISEGVRHALSLILGELARAGQTVALPQDVYPVYGQIATDAGVRTVGVTTFPEVEAPALFDTASREGASVVLLPSPFKLHGRCWTDEEADEAIAWLGADRQRRLILDGVYAFGLPLDARTRRLLDTGQALYLDSLSKGWLHEKVLGVALVPEEDAHRYSAIFQSLAPSQEKLWLANELLTCHADFPARLVAEIDQRRHALVHLLDGLGLAHSHPAQGYLVAVEASAEVLLQDHRLLTMPASVFGSPSRDWSIASALPFRALAR